MYPTNNYGAYVVKPITDTYLNIPQGSSPVLQSAVNIGDVQGATAPPPLDINQNTTPPPSVGPTAEQIAASQLSTNRTKAKSKLDAYNALFSGLFGKIDTAAAEQAATTRANYGQQRTDLTDQYNADLPNLDMSYYLGGIGDSSLRLAGRGQAEKALQKSINAVGVNEANDLTGIGKEAAKFRAGYQADQSGIDLIRSQIDQTTDPQELQQLQNDIQAKIAGISADTAGFETGGTYRGQLASVAPAKDLGPIKSTLSSLMSGAANPALKTQIATQIIDNAGLSPDQTKLLYDTYVNAPVA